MVRKFMIKLIFTISFIAYASVSAAQELTSQAEQLANQNYYRENLISLLYDNDMDYRSAFNCTGVMFEKPNDNGAVDAGCMNDADILWISMTMGPRRRLSSAYVCPSTQDRFLVEELKGLSSENDKLENGATTYRMGLTNGWLRKFENVFVTMNQGGMSLSCWSLNRR